MLARLETALPEHPGELVRLRLQARIGERGSAHLHGDAGGFDACPVPWIKLHGADAYHPHAY